MNENLMIIERAILNSEIEIVSVKANIDKYDFVIKNEDGSITKVSEDMLKVNKLTKKIEESV